MREKGRGRTYKKSGFSVLRLLWVAGLVSAAILAARFPANLISRAEIIGMLQKVDIEAYKAMMNVSLPIMNRVYDNGNVSTSLSGRINDITKYFFSFDMNDPISVLNAQSSALSFYYNGNYRALQENNTADEGMEVKISYDFIPEVPGDNNSGGLEEAASSISMNSVVEKEEPPKGNIESAGKITLRNETKYKVNIDELIKEPLKFKFNQSKDRILIYHTHTTESYLTNISQLNAFVPTRTRDARYSVVRVGEELAENMRKKFGMQVIHNATIHDYPDYNSSYSNSLKTVTAILKAYPNIKVVVDLHRDAIADDKKLREVAAVNGKNAAKIMFVVATGEEKKNHPNWKENLKLALKIQEKLNEQCPQLTLPIQLSKYTYNQHMSSGALLIEIGGDGNLLEECLESTKYLAAAMHAVINP